MRIVLVHPAGYNWVPGKKDITPTANRMAPNGLLSIAAYLSLHGHQVFIHDCLGPQAPRRVRAHIDKIMSHKPEMVGFSTTTSGFLDGYTIAAQIKAKEPQVVTVFGGVHVSALGADLLKRFEAIDYLCIGEGEVTLNELADGRSPATINGLAWRRNGRVVTNAVRDHLPDLDRLPFPAYDKLIGFPKGYHLPLFSYVYSPGGTMITSRGCPYQCSYCDRSVFKRGYRYNSAEYIYEHMRYLKTRFGIRHIIFYDDLFTLHQDRIDELCHRLTARPLGMQFNCAVRVGHCDNDLLRMLKSAGCLQVSLGIETGDPDLMQTHKPGVYLDQVGDTVKRIQACGLRAKGLFMMGLPGETETSIRRTSDFALSLGLDDMNMSKFTPFHGAPLWTQIHEKGQLEEDWRQMNCLNFVFVPNTIESKQKLEFLYNWHVKRFYTDKSWRRKFVSRWWQHRRSLWHMLVHLPTFLAAKRNFEPGQH